MLLLDMFVFESIYEYKFTIQNIYANMSNNTILYLFSFFKALPNHLIVFFLILNKGWFHKVPVLLYLFKLYFQEELIDVTFSYYVNAFILNLFIDIAL